MIERGVAPLALGSVYCRLMRTLVGTSGYSYPAWKKHFYPEDLPAKEMLAYYRGLAGAVSTGKGRPVDGSKFTFGLEPAKEATGTPEKIPASTKVTQYTGEQSVVVPLWEQSK